MPANGRHGDVAMVADLLAGLDMPDLALPATAGTGTGAGGAVRRVRCAGVPRGGRSRTRSTHRLTAWARARWTAGERLDPAVAVAQQVCGTQVAAALALTRWLAVELGVHAVRTGVADVLAAGICDPLAPQVRARQASWLLTQVRPHQAPEHAGEAAEGPSRSEPARVGATDLPPPARAARRGQHADGPARALLAFTPTTAQETSDLYVAAAIPPGARRVAQAVWWGVVASTVAGTGLRADAAQTVLQVAEELMVCADWTTCTTRPGWARLAEGAGVCVRTVGRVLARLRAWRLLGGVVGGRSAPFARTAADAGTNRCAVYVLCAPIIGEVAGQAGSVIPSPGPVAAAAHPVHARENQTRAGPLRGTDPPGGAAARRGPGTSPGTRLDLPRPAVPWPAHRVPRTRSERMEAALDLRWRVPALRGASTAGVASVLRVLHGAGWSVADVLVAIERTPDGSARAHDGAHGVRHPRGWLAARLAAWVDEDVRPLPSATRAADARRAAALDRARRRRDAAASEGPANSARGPSAGYLACRAALAAATVGE